MKVSQSQSSEECGGVGPTEMCWGGSDSCYLETENKVLLVPKMVQRSWKVF
jgi:hypothetical protein